MTYTPKFLKLWTHPDNYAGAIWEGFYSAGFGQSRDSDCLERSNFRVAWDAISSVPQSALIVRENHWAVGWVEWIAIRADAYEALEIADKLKAKMELHPVIDEDDLGNLEHEDAYEIWSHCYNVKERIAYIAVNREQFDFRSLADMLGCVRGKYFAGYASELVSR